MKFVFKIEEMIQHLLDEKKYSAIRDIFSTMTTKDLTTLFNRVEEKNIPILMGLICANKVNEIIEIEGMPAQTGKHYLLSTPVELFRHRIAWLLVLMVSATFTGMIITGFENALAVQVALTAFIPMLMDTGGNSGFQSSVTIIRALTLGEVSFRDLPKIIWKEMRVAFLCGTSLAAVCFAKIILVDRDLLHNYSITLPIALVVCAAMIVTVMVSKMIGCALPICAKRLHADPAVMSGPFITTIVDATSLMVYFTIARAVLF
ncbi:MAG: magnesium transporter [Treponema sp.]|nr:magnesium transporter [Treponema sp.]